MPKAFEMNLKGITSLEGVELIEFCHDFYFERFRDISKSTEANEIYNLRLCAFIDLGEEV